MFLLKSNQTCFILDNRKGYTYWPAGRMIPHKRNFMGRGLRTTLTFGGRNLVRCLFGMEVMNMPMIVYTRRRI